jgi:hypothetical protein
VTFTVFSDASCGDIRPLIPMLVGAHPSGSGGLPGEWSSGGWSCETTVRAHADIVPMSGCARVVFVHGASLSDGSPSLAPALEQVIAIPDVRNATTPAPHYGVVSLGDGTTLERPTSAQSNEFVPQLRDVEAVVRDYGISVLAMNLVAMTELNDRDSHATRGSPTTWPIAQSCGGNLDDRWRGTAVPSASWSAHGGHGNLWTLVTAGGYDCHLADPIFRTFLANLAVSTETPSLGGSASSGPLHRFGWQCDPSQANLLTVCRFTPLTYDRLDSALGRTVPRSFRLAVSAYGVPTLADNRGKTAIS